MKEFTILLIFAISLLADPLPNKKQLEKEFELRFGNKKTRSLDTSAIQDNFFTGQKFNPKLAGKKYRNFPFPPLPPFDSTENNPPSPTPSPETIPTEKDNKLSDYKGKYEVTRTDSQGNMSVKFKENVSIRINGKILKLVIDPSFNYHANFNKEEKLTSNYAHLAEPVKAKVGKYNLQISSWVSFYPNGNISFLSPGGDNLDFQIGNYTIKYNSTSKTGYLQKIFFYEDGAIDSIHIREPQTLQVGGQSIEFDHHEGCGGDLDFYQTGALKGGYLAKPTQINGTNFPKESYIGFYESGKVQKTAFPGTITIQGYSVSTNDSYWPVVEFHSNGKIQKLKALAKDTLIGGKTYTKGQIINFKEDGSVEYAY
jgi:hypothetical protein